MKKVIIAVAVLAIGLMALQADAQITRLYRVTGTTQVYVGAPRTALPATARMTQDDAGASAIVFFWTEGGVKKVSDVFICANAWFGAFGNMYWNQVQINRDVVLPPPPAIPTTDQTRTAWWQFIGLGSGVAMLPASTRGVVQSWVADNITADLAGFGYGACTASGYRTLGVGEADAIWGATVLAAELAAQGYVYEPAIY
ncbi:MAG: hypothetical protein BWY59_01217 [Verrucomicrobia bacterium ADurb.Bin345]|nr:MAG: hypothetical protein BWY59_01217 [Verrucomicrobia bacterium ADurb.Bin345]